MQPSSTPAGTSLDLVDLALGASGPVKAVLLALGIASLLVWFIFFLKLTQLAGLRRKNLAFEREASTVELTSDLLVVARRHPDASGGRVVTELGRRRTGRPASKDYLLAIAKRVLASEQQRASVLMPTLASIASASPFVGLFGTVYGIIEAFQRIGLEKSASLPVVAPAIGEALVATAVGLFAAIPATIFYNYVDKKIADFFDEIAAGAEAWVALLSENTEEEAVPLRRGSFPMVGGG